MDASASRTVPDPLTYAATTRTVHAVFSRDLTVVGVGTDPGTAHWFARAELAQCLQSLLPDLRGEALQNRVDAMLQEGFSAAFDVPASLHGALDLARLLDWHTRPAHTAYLGRLLGLNHQVPEHQPSSEASSRGDVHFFVPHRAAEAGGGTPHDRTRARSQDEEPLCDAGVPSIRSRIVEQLRERARPVPSPVLQRCVVLWCDQHGEPQGMGEIPEDAQRDALHRLTSGLLDLDEPDTNLQDLVQRVLIQGTYIQLLLPDGPSGEAILRGWLRTLGLGETPGENS